MQIITLTTDWGYKDFYTGMVKANLYNAVPNVNIVDITHGIKKYESLAATFVVRNACLNFPEGTIHIIDVNSFESKNSQFIVVKANNQFYICTDNGLPSLIFKGIDVEITSTEYVYEDSNYYTFAVWDKFCKIAKVLANAKSTETLGTRIEKFAIDSPSYNWFREDDTIVCKVAYIDDYGNVFLNITHLEFKQELNGRKFELRLDNRYTINNVVQSYQDVEHTGTALLTISATGNLELAMKESNIARLMGYKVNDSLKIKIL
ncbi:MAG: SAM-dependent chlorinase/fluorinase [Bacteroidales bacterium]|nr:SAM-dependent chlorinase/fluorinase [Bacteroidales bacterium]